MTADLGANTVILDKFGMITSFEEFINANRRNKDITLADADFLRERMTLAQSVGVQGFSRAEIRSPREKMNNVTVKGNTPNMVNIDSTQPEFGRYISETDNEHRRSVALIGAEVADNSSARAKWSGARSRSTAFRSRSSAWRKSRGRSSANRATISSSFRSRPIRKFSARARA